MNTPAHLIFGAAAFGRPEQRGTLIAALIGAMIPDLSLYLLSAWHLLILGTPEQVVFGQLYFSPLWQGIFRVDNSLILWGIGLTLALMARLPWAIALTGAALLHIGLDLPLHHDDGRAHFWPLTDWIFQSPISYWDTNHHAGIVGPLEIAVSLALAALIWRRFRDVWVRVLVAVLAALELAPALFWVMIF